MADVANAFGWLSAQGDQSHGSRRGNGSSRCRRSRENTCSCCCWPSTLSRGEAAALSLLKIPFWYICCAIRSRYTHRMMFEQVPRDSHPLAWIAVPTAPCGCHRPRRKIKLSFAQGQAGTKLNLRSRRRVWFSHSRCNSAASIRHTPVVCSWRFLPIFSTRGQASTGETISERECTNVPLDMRFARCKSRQDVNLRA